MIRFVSPHRGILHGSILLFILSILPLTLRDSAAAPIAEGKQKFIGNVINSRGSVPVNFKEYWNQVTPENAGKWGSIERTRDAMSWRWLDSAYLYAEKNDLPFKLHTLLWGNQVPSWIATLSLQEQLDEVVEWFEACSTRYPALDYIDVVNEALHSIPPYREALGGAGTTGWDWVIRGFEKARICFPNSKLLINDFDIVNIPDNTEKYLQIINLLLERHLVDGIGVQTHWFSVRGCPPDIIKSNLDRLAQTGLPIYSSEFDIDGDDAAQLREYKSVFPALWEHPAIAGITLWGWLEGTTWKDSTWLVRKDGTERPAMVWLREYITGSVGTARPFLMQDSRKKAPPMYPGITAPVEPGVFDLLGRNTAQRRPPALSKQNCTTMPQGVRTGVFLRSDTTRSRLIINAHP